LSETSTNDGYRFLLPHNGSFGISHYTRPFLPRLTTIQDNKSLKQIVDEKNKTNPSQLGDPVSLKAETSDTQPTKDDLGAKGGSGGDGKKTLKERAEEKLASGNPTQLGDPVSLKAETSDTEPTPDDRGALKTKKNDPNGSGKSKL
jgi:hypothetical protein